MSFFKDIFAGQFRGWQSFLPNLNLKDFQHASRMFVDDAHARSPKLKFLFYVNIEINPNALPASFTSNQKLELNMLVKKCDLPSYDFTYNERNSYNKRTYNYARTKYNAVNMTFHDDSANIVNAFWRSYYQYQVQDGNLGSNRYQNDKYGPRQWADYGINNSTSAIRSEEHTSELQSH